VAQKDLASFAPLFLGSAAVVEVKNSTYLRAASIELSLPMTFAARSHPAANNSAIRWSVRGPSGCSDGASRSDDLHQRRCSVGGGSDPKLAPVKLSMPPSTAPFRKQNRSRPALTAEEWEETERALEKAERDLQLMYNAMYGGELHPADSGGNVFNVAKDSKETPRQISGWVVFMLALIDSARTLDPDNKNWDIWAKFFLLGSAAFLGSEVSVEILYHNFGRGVLKRSLSKQRGPTSIHGQDNAKIRIYIDAIMWATGESVRGACRRLAKMGLKVRKDGAQGGASIDLNKPEAIRKRYMNAITREFYEKDKLWLKIYEKEILRLKVIWHRSGEPPFPNWLKQLISRETASPNAADFPLSEVIANSLLARNSDAETKISRTHPILTHIRHLGDY
jgi:hypothetical protein